MDPTTPKLPKRQAECLRLVAAGLTSKEIALELGIGSKHTVDGYIAEAVTALGVGNRREAARLWQGLREPLTESGADPARVVADPVTDEPEGALPDWQIVHEPERLGGGLPFPTRSSPRNALTPLITVGWIFAIALLSLAAAALAVAIGNGATGLALRANGSVQPGNR
ncbi:MAG TPA: helix-turn-helix transcriptional regulator [Sphingomonas sp.]|jgi:DNA-binding CsgD family transcriptional regulator|uniref:helix-turn-helix transcriptional regulator n=1 Tax=Sphingomonas sp. TaxID=28214 RepID=UPI002EDAB65C